MIPTLYVDSEAQAGHQVCTASIYHLSYAPPPSPLDILFFWGWERHGAFCQRLVDKWWCLSRHGDPLMPW